MKTILHRPSRGFSLIEVMIAVVVLSFGLLALAALQANLFRAGAETKARANATAIAQQVIENAKTFAFLSPPAGYLGTSYRGLATAKLDNQTVGGVSYTVCRQVRRYRHDTATARFVALNGVDGAACADTAAVGATLDPGTPEFKEVRVSVAWSGDVGQAKSVELTDAVAAIAPADSIQVVKTPTATSRGPEVWIVPPNKDNPQVVPIAIGDNLASASSNPKPEQFVDDLSAATKFSVMTFTGSSAGLEVQLNRKLDIAAVSCLCQRSGTEVSSASSPAYLPTVWNGKQRAYIEPQPAPAGTKIGLAVSVNTDITPMCTTCCRDHHEASGRASPRPDPWRTLTSSEGTEEHWGYKKQGGSYLIGGPLVQFGTSSSATSGEYLEACQLVRVNGQLRMAVDTQQSDLMEAPLNDAGTNYRDSNFATNYANYVKQLVREGMASLPSGYAAPTARFPKASAALTSNTDYAGMLTPATIDVTSAAVGTKRQMVGFGLYVDYLSADTRAAYNCALTKNNEGSCSGLGTLDPLETLPFYAVNMANLGTWTSSRPGAVSVADAQFKQGLIDADGGIATVQTGTLGTASAPQDILIKLAVNNSNSGLAGTLPVDPDDADVSNVLTDLQKFLRTGSSTAPTFNSLFVKLTSTTTLSIKTLIVKSPEGGVICGAVSGSDPTKNCRFASPAATLTVSITGYTTTTKTKNTTVLNDRKVCVPAGVPISVSGNGTTSDTTVLTFSNLLQNDYRLTIDIVNETDACPTGSSFIAL